VHHESAAAFIAEAYFRVTHRPAATFTSCGPGSANLLVGVAAAFAFAASRRLIVPFVAYALAFAYAAARAAGLIGGPM
jgi:TPP-dependent trihydroxycyclohexane-1,2-dione (THcHDO) dehydratase